MQKIRIGTRKSPLALWQAELVSDLLNQKGHETEIVAISSEGDLQLKQPIYELGITGVFTRSLDIAMLNDQIDIAVHSLKDVPTTLPQGIQLVSHIKRGNPYDVLVYKDKNIFQKNHRTIATGSLRRKSFWLHQYPKDEVVGLRGNVQLRLQKLKENDWDGAIFAYAGIDRSGILDELTQNGLHYQIIEWMTPAPSQGIIGITAREEFQMPEINDRNAMMAATIERQFLNTLEGGCTAPIGGFAKVTQDEIEFEGAILTVDGQEMIKINEKISIDDYELAGKNLAEICIQNGASAIIESIKKDIN